MTTSSASQWPLLCWDSVSKPRRCGLWQGCCRACHLGLLYIRRVALTGGAAISLRFHPHGLLVKPNSLLLLVKPNLLLARGSLLLLVKLRILLARGSLLLLVVLRPLLARGSLRLLDVLRAVLARGSLQSLCGKGRLLLLVVELRVFAGHVLGNFPFAGAKGSRFGLGRCHKTCSAASLAKAFSLILCLLAWLTVPVPWGRPLLFVLPHQPFQLSQLAIPFLKGCPFFQGLFFFQGNFARELQSPLVKGVQKQKIFELETAAVESGDGSTWCVCVCVLVCVCVCLCVWCMWETCYEEKKSIHSKTHTSQCLDIY